MSPPPPPPPQYPGGPYGSPVGGYGAAPVSHPSGTTVLVLGILSLLLCGLILGPIAWIKGNKAIKEIDAAPGRYNNRGTVNAGRICGIIGTVLAIPGVIWLLTRASS